ncbi:MAG TPA: hypothetical protein VF666_21555 [Pyrinomonadaceae bacterium]|jgi:hypothetical protein
MREAKVAEIDGADGKRSGSSPEIRVSPGRIAHDAWSNFVCRSVAVRASVAFLCDDWRMRM